MIQMEYGRLSRLFPSAQSHTFRGSTPWSFWTRMKRSQRLSKVGYIQLFHRFILISRGQVVGWLGLGLFSACLEQLIGMVFLNPRLFNGQLNHWHMWLGSLVSGLHQTMTQACTVLNRRRIPRPRHRAWSFTSQIFDRAACLHPVKPAGIRLGPGIISLTNANHFWLTICKVNIVIKQSIDMPVESKFWLESLNSSHKVIAKLES